MLIGSESAVYIAAGAYICDESGEHMPTWAPPTPPQDDNDVYIDCSMYFMYEPNVMLESQLPAIYVKKEQKRIRIDPAVAVARKHKVRKEEHHRVPRSLFDRPQSLLRKERDLKLMKLKQFAKPLKPQLLQSRPHDTADVTHSDWLVHEDWALLQALQMLQELPLTLATDSPAIIPNWDLVADMVNACSRTCRSIKQCKNRYENVIVPREEGKILYDVNPRKQKKSKGIYKVGTKNNRPMRTSQLYLQDNSNAITSQYSLRFDSSKSISAKRTPTIRPTLANPTLKNPKHAAVLAENGINYEQPLTPTQVAAIRAERIAKEKQKNQEAAQQQIATGQRTTTTQAAVTTTPTAAVVAPALAGTTTVQTVVAGQQMAIIPGTQLVSSVPGAPTTVVVTAAGLQKATAGSAVAAVSLARTLGPTGSIVVNPASANPFAAINKKIAGQTLVGTLAQTLTTTANSSTAQAVRAVAARSGTTHMTVQEIAAVVNQSPARVGAHNTAQVITTTTLTPAQIIAAQKGGTVITAGAVPQGQLATKTLTPQQLQILRLRQQQLRRLTAVQAAASQHSQTVTGVGQAAGGQKSVSVTTPLITSIAQSQVSAARLQLAKQPGIKGSTITRSLSETEMAILLKRQQLQQRTLSGATLVSQGATPVQQVQVSQGHMARFTTAQILTGTQVQQVHAGQSASVVSSGSQPVATLVKTVTTQGSATVPSVTIPVTAVNLGLGISVNVPTQKALPAKNIVTQQMRQIQLQQLQRTKHIQVAAAQQKVATLGQLQQVKGPGGTTPLIIPPQQQTATLPKVMVQQIHQIVKQQPTMQQPTIQQIIASVPPSQTTTATVIATQLVSQAQPTVQTVTKMSVPSGFASSAVTQAIRLTTPMTANTITGTTSHGITLTTGGLVTGTPTVTLTPSQTTLVKNLQDVMTPQKSLTGTIQQVKTVQQATAAVRQIQGAAGVTLAQIPSTHSVIPAVQVQQLTSPGPTVAVTTTPKIIQQQAPQQQPSTVIQQQLVQPGTTSAQMVQSSPGVQQAIQMVQPSPGVQQAVQKVVQEAQAQAQHRVAVTVGGTTITHHAPVTVTQSPVVSGTQAQTIQQLPTSVAVAVTGQAPILGQAPITGQVTLPGQAPMPGQAQILGQASLAGQDPKNDKNSPYSMRLRNQRT